MCKCIHIYISMYGQLRFAYTVASTQINLLCILYTEPLDNRISRDYKHSRSSRLYVFMHCFKFKCINYRNLRPTFYVLLLSEAWEI